MAADGATDMADMADMVFLWWESLMRELLSAPGRSEHPRRLPGSGFSICCSHWPIVWHRHGRQGYVSSEILKPHSSWGFLSAQGACCNFPGRELMKMGCGLFLARGGLPFQRLRNPQTLGCYLDNLVLIPSLCKPFQAAVSARVGSL